MEEQTKYLEVNSKKENKYPNNKELNRQDLIKKCFLTVEGSFVIGGAASPSSVSSMVT